MIRPLDDRVLLKMPERERKTSKGIIVPATAVAQPNQVAEVIAIGPGAIRKGQRVPVAVKPGDYVLCANMGDHVWDQGVEYRIVREHAILCRVRKG